MSGSLARAAEAFRRGDFERAERLLRRVLLTEPSSSRANELLAYIAGNRGEDEAAHALLDKATQDPRASREAWYYLGVSFQRHARHADAIDAFARALAIDARFVEAHFDRGVSLDALRRHEEAIESYERALEIDPRHVPSWTNLGAALIDAGRHEEALARFDRAREISPRHVEAWSGRAIALHYLRRHSEALHAFDEALRLRPGDADVLWRAFFTRAAAGDLPAAWALFEERWNHSEAQTRRHAQMRAWRGAEPLAGKRVLAWCEQGYGDTLQFCRYVPSLASEAAGVVVEVQPALRTLIASSFPQCGVIAQGDRVPACDLQIPLVSLPFAFRTALDSIPAQVPYLRADPAKVDAWRGRLGDSSGRMRIGIACSGSAQTRMDRSRSIPLETFAPLERHADLFLIQKEVRAADEAWLRANARIVRDLRDSLGDFEDAAACAGSMDLVVTVDTALAHLAGALGKPVWVLLAFESEWRWLLDRADSPWYPTARLWRQARADPWSAVMTRVESALSALRR